MLRTIVRSVDNFPAAVSKENSGEFASFALERVVTGVVNNLERYESQASDINRISIDILIELGTGTHQQVGCSCADSVYRRLPSCTACDDCDGGDVAQHCK